jgi:hypothetical protein
MTDAMLADRVLRLEARDEICALMAQYLYLADRDPDPDKIAALFAEDAIWEPRGNLAVGQQVSRGRAQIRELFVGLPKLLTFAAHYITNAVVDVAEDATSAHGRWHTFELIGRDEPKQQIVQLAWYENDFTRVDGRWLIQHIRFEDTLSFPYLEGWGETRFVSLVTGELVPHPGWA